MISELAPQIGHSASSLARVTAMYFGSIEHKLAQLSGTLTQ